MKQRKRNSALSLNLIKKSKYTIIFASVLIILVIASVIAVVLISRSGYGEIYDASEEESAFVSDGTVCVRFLDVGQGDCILITSNNGKNVVIDAGTYEHPGCALSLLDSYGADEIEYLILTHPDADHIGDADDIIDGKTVKNIILTNESSDTETYGSFMSSLKNAEDINIIIGSYDLEFYVGSVKFSVLSPSDVIVPSSNDSSIVVMAEYGKTRFLFTGDAETAAEEEMIKIFGKKLKCNVLKIAHHGSSSSSSERFLKYTSPDCAVISCGENNGYGHPHDVIIKRLKKLGIKYYRTDKSGTITFITDGITIEKATER